jgi:SAM-dependent methyltransferase
MTKRLKQLAIRVLDKLADRIIERVTQAGVCDELFDHIAYRVALERMVDASNATRKPNEIFGRISDGLWLWFCTQGYRRSPALRRILPGLPSEAVQLQFNGKTGDAVLQEGFASYQLFKDLYERHVRLIADAGSILDFGCGWGRIIRFFMRDVDPSRLWGADPMQEMIEICRAQNKWCNFTRIDTSPPTRFEDTTFDFIYSFSVFSHLSEEMQDRWLGELQRILKPDGLLVVTTRGREFIEHCAALRKLKDLDSLPKGQRISAGAFLDTAECLRSYDQGKYCYTQLVHEGEWSYWGDTAIPRQYVLDWWTRYFSYVDYIDDRMRCSQNVIVMRKTPQIVAASRTSFPAQAPGAGRRAAAAVISQKVPPS